MAKQNKKGLLQQSHFAPLDRKGHFDFNMMNGFEALLFIVFYFWVSFLFLEDFTTDGKERQR